MVDNETDFGSVELDHPWRSDGYRVLLIWSRLRKSGLAAYGFACERTLDRAFFRARGEQLRSFVALSTLENATDMMAPDRDLSLQEVMDRRLAYFSTDRGFGEFLGKIAQAKQVPKVASPVAVVDTEIAGPWTQYATVWRCLYEMPSRQHLSRRSDYFMF